MYGYLKWIPSGKRIDKLTNTYKFYYCSLCTALKKNYGLLSTLFLSNDITYIMIVISKSAIKCDKKINCCLRKSKAETYFTNIQWSHMAALSIGIAYAKMLDNYFDDKSICSYLKLQIVKLISLKAIKKNKDLFKFLLTSMKEISRKENEGIDLDVQGNLTAKLLIDAIQFNDVFILSEAEKDYILMLSKWLCLIDAIDDYEDDTMRNRFNPLNEIKVLNGFDDEQDITKKEYLLSKYYNDIAIIYASISKGLREALKKINCSSIEKEIVETMTYQCMPLKLAQILKK